MAACHHCLHTSIFLDAHPHIYMSSHRNFCGTENWKNRNSRLNLEGIVQCLAVLKSYIFCGFWWFLIRSFLSQPLKRQGPPTSPSPLGPQQRFSQPAWWHYPRLKLERPLCRRCPVRPTGLVSPSVGLSSQCLSLPPLLDLNLEIFSRLSLTTLLPMPQTTLLISSPASSSQASWLSSRWPQPQLY